MKISDILSQQQQSQPVENSGSSTSSSGSSGGSGNYGTLGRGGGGGGMASMMDEMAKTLARRRAAAEKKQPEQLPVDISNVFEILQNKCIEKHNLTISCRNQKVHQIKNLGTKIIHQTISSPMAVNLRNRFVRGSVPPQKTLFWKLMELTTESHSPHRRWRLLKQR